MNQIGSIAVIGAGAVGLYYGGRLAKAGHEVHFFTRGDAAALRERGLHVRSHHGDFQIQASEIHAYDRIDAMPRTDWIVSTLKATAKPHYRELIAPLLRDGTPIVALQNGIGNEEELAKHFGTERILGAIAYVCIHRTAPGQIHHSAQGDLKIGEFGRPVSARATALTDALKLANVPAAAVDDLRYFRWHKQIWNIAFNGLGAALDLDCAQLIATPEGRDLLATVMREVIRAAGAVGVQFEASMVDFQINRTHALGAYKTSMHLDRLAGRAMEIEAIVGEPIRQAAAAGVTDLPALAAVYQSLNAIDAANRAGCA